MKDEPAGRGKQPSDSRLLINVLLLALTFFVLLNFFFVYQMKFQLKKITGSTSAVQNAELILIEAPDCADCIGIDAIASSIHTKKINITQEKKIPWTDPEAKGLIEKYGITSVPSLILRGESLPLYIDPLSRVADALVLLNTPAPFIDAGSGNIKGLVTMTLITAPDCKECFDVGIAEDQIKEALSVKETRRLSYKDNTAKEILISYKIKTVPSLILSSEAEFYPEINLSWESVGTRESDKSLVLRILPPPLLEVESGKITGLVSLTFVSDSSCMECYNTSIHLDVLKDMGIAIKDQMSVEYSSKEGAELCKKYNITEVPTIIISNEAVDYPLFASVWPSVGSQESDGSFVFREFASLGKIRWRDLTTGRVKGIPTYVVNFTSNTTTIID